MEETSKSQQRSEESFVNVNVSGDVNGSSVDWQTSSQVNQELAVEEPAKTINDLDETVRQDRYDQLLALIESQQNTISVEVDPPSKVFVVSGCPRDPLMSGTGDLHVDDSNAAELQTGAVLAVEAPEVQRNVQLVQQEVISGSAGLQVKPVEVSADVGLNFSGGGGAEVNVGGTERQPEVQLRTGAVGGKDGLRLSASGSPVEISRDSQREVSPGLVLEVKHKRRIIEEVVVVDSDTFYESLTRKSKRKSKSPEMAEEAGGNLSVTVGSVKPAAAAEISTSASVVAPQITTTAKSQPVEVSSNQSVTYVVNYDLPSIHLSEPAKVKAAVKPAKIKVSSPPTTEVGLSGTAGYQIQTPEITSSMQSVTYIINYDWPSKQPKGDVSVEVSGQAPSIKTSGKAAIDIDLPISVQASPPQTFGSAVAEVSAPSQSVTYVVNYTVPVKDRRKQPTAVSASASLPSTSADISCEVRGPSVELKGPQLQYGSEPQSLYLAMMNYAYEGHIDLNADGRVKGKQGKKPKKSGDESVQVTYVTKYDLPAKLKTVQPTISASKDVRVTIPTVSTPEIQLRQSLEPEVQVYVSPPSVKTKGEISASLKPERPPSETVTYIVNYDFPSIEIAASAGVPSKPIKVAAEHEVGWETGAKGKIDMPSVKTEVQPPTLSVKQSLSVGEAAKASVSKETKTESVTYIVQYEPPTAALSKAIARPDIDLGLSGGAVADYKVKTDIGAKEVTVRPLSLKGEVAPSDLETVTYVVNYEPDVKGLPSSGGRIEVQPHLPQYEAHGELTTTPVEVSWKPGGKKKVEGAKVPVEGGQNESITYVVSYELPVNAGISAKAALPKQKVKKKGKAKATKDAHAEFVIPQLEHEPRVRHEASASAGLHLEPYEGSIQGTVVGPQIEFKTATKLETPQVKLPALSTSGEESVTYIVRYDYPEKSKAKIQAEVLPKVELTAPKRLETEVSGKVDIPDIDGLAEVELPEMVFTTSTCRRMSQTTENLDYETSVMPVPALQIESDFGVEHATVATGSITLPKEPEIVVASVPVVSAEPPASGQTVTYIVNYGSPKPKPTADKKTKNEKKKAAGGADLKLKVRAPKVGVTPSAEIDVTGFEGSEVSAVPTGEKVTYIVTYDVPTVSEHLPELKVSKDAKKRKAIAKAGADAKVKLPKIEGQVEPVDQSVKYVVKSKVPEVSLPEGQAKLSAKTKKPEVPTLSESNRESVTYIVNYETPTASVSGPEIKLPEVKIKKSAKAEFELNAPKTGADIKVKAPKAESQVEPVDQSVTYVVKSEAPEVSLPAGQARLSAKVKKSEVPASKEPSVNRESVTYIVNYETPTVSVFGPQIKLPEVKMKKSVKADFDINAPKASANIKVKAPKIEGQMEPVDQSVTYAVKSEAPEVSLPEGKVKLAAKVNKPDVPTFKEPSPNRESVTYIVNYETPTSSVSGPEIKLPEVKIKKSVKTDFDINSPSIEFEGPDSVDKSATYVVNYETPQVSTPKAKLQLEKKFEMVMPSTETSLQVKPPKVDLQAGPGDESVTYDVNYDTPDVSVDHAQKIKLPRGELAYELEIRPTAEVDLNAAPLSVEPSTESVTYVVDYDHPQVSVPEATADSELKLSREAVHVDAEVERPKASIDLQLQCPDVQMTPSVSPAPSESQTVTYVVNWDSLGRPIIGGVKGQKPKAELNLSSDTDYGIDMQPSSLSPSTSPASDFADLTLSFESSATDGQQAVSHLEGSTATPAVKVCTDLKATKPEAETADMETVTYIVNYDEPSPVRLRWKPLGKSGGRKSPRGGGTLEKDVAKTEYTVQLSAQKRKSDKDGSAIRLWMRSVDDGEDFKGRHLVGSTESDVTVGLLPQPLIKVPPQFVVVAIDFGTTFSGYAFSFAGGGGGGSRLSTGSLPQPGIHMMRRWEGGDPGVVNQKTPTTLLLSPDGEFHSFGFTARDFYHDLSPRQARKWLYFEKFKMALHNEPDLNPSTELPATNGEKMSALAVFSHALRFFKNHALQEISDQAGTEIISDDVLWVVTVPAIWREPAKQFMRLAAYQAGLASANRPGNLLIALEPESASIEVRRQHLHQLVPDSPGLRRSRSPRPGRSAPGGGRVSPEPSRLSATGEQLTADAESIESAVRWSYYIRDTPVYSPSTVADEVDIPGTRYLIVDCGGGTVDITGHELTSDGSLKELLTASGGPFGSIGIDMEFERLLVTIFGADFIDAFKTRRPAGWVDLMMAFESRKRAADPARNKPLNVSLPFSFIDYHKKYRTTTVESAIRRYGDKDITWSTQGMMKLMPAAMKRLFQPTLDSIKVAIGNALNDPAVKGVKFMFLVGGFAESPMLQQEIRNEFKHLVKIVIPQDGSLAILKGAVCFGVQPSQVAVRRSPATYAVAVVKPFEPGHDLNSKRVERDGCVWCTDLLDVLVYAGQALGPSDTVVRRYRPASKTITGPPTAGVFDVYRSERTDVIFTTDSDVTKCGTLQLELDPGSSGDEIELCLSFGNTEVGVSASDVTSGRTTRAVVDFLGK